jgi:hypothetical protein
VLLRGVTHDPSERWASMVELLTALDRATSKRRRPLDYLRAWMGPRGTK